MNIEQKKLSNGLETLFVNSPGATAGTVQVWFKAGSALEKNDNQGVAHFLEHMFFKGTEKRPGAQIASEVEGFGGEINAFTSFDYTCYYINSPSDKVKNSVNILMDMVANPTFKEEELLPEREVVFEEYRRSLDNPHQYNFSKVQNLCFTGGYKHKILGREETIKGFTREQVVQFRKDHYNKSNIMVIVAGDLTSSKNEVENTLKQFDIPDGSTNNFPEFALSKKSKVQLYNFDVRMCTVTLAIQAPQFNTPEAAYEDLALNCLAYGESSRLYQELILKNTLGNSVSGSTTFFSNGGIHFIRIVCPPENLKEIHKNFLQVIKNVKKSPLTAKEITRIKNQYIASKTYEKESLESYVFSLGHGYAQNGDIFCDDKFIDMIKSASEEQINKSLRKIFSRPIHGNIQLPKECKSSAFKNDFQKFKDQLENVFPTEGKKKARSIKSIKSKFDPSAQVINLKKGVDLIYRQNLMTPTFNMQCYIKGGLTEENDKTNGTYYLLSNSIVKGHSKIPYKKIKSQLEEMASSMSGFSGKNAYGLTMHGLSEYSKELFDHFFKTLIKPDFGQKHYKHELEILRRNLENEKEEPVRQCFKALNRLIFEGHPYALPISGSLDSIKNISNKKVKDLHFNNLKSKNMVITYCGNAGLEEVLQQIEPYVKQIKPRPTKKPKSNKQKVVYGKEIEIPFSREQFQIFIGYPSFSMTDKRDNFIKMLSYHLSGQSSELFVEVRDRQGLCYAVQPVHFSGLEGGYWGIYIGAGNDKKEKAITAITDILNRLANHGVTQTEFVKIKNMIHGQSLLNIQTNEDYANIYSVPVLQGLGMDQYYKNNQKIAETSIEEFNGFLKDFLKKEPNKVIVGPL